MRSPSYNQANAVLFLDDDFDIVTIFKQGLEKRGFEIFGFTDPLLALEHFRLNFEKYGLVISDLRMPEMNGYEFIELRKYGQMLKSFL